jgi:cobalt/nickel transport system permease protein
VNVNSEAGSGPRRRHNYGRQSFVEKTLADLAQTLEQSLFAEDIARRPGLLQALDPRAKVISILALLIAVGLSRSLPVLLGLYGVALVLAWRSAVPLGFFVKRVWLFMPFFTGLIALPALFITPGPVLVPLPLGLAITRPGALTALFLLLRVSTSVSLGVLLMLTTAWPTLLKALSVLRVPESFILILGMTYRYIYLLLRTAEDMFLSRKSRIVGRMPAAAERQVLAASAGTLLNKSLHLSSEVYLAMQSRGYGGKLRTMDTFRMRAYDWLWGAAILAVVAAAVWLGR